MAIIVAVQKIFSKKHELRAAVLAVLTHMVFLLIFAYTYGVNKGVIEPPHFIQLRLGSAAGAAEIAPEMAPETAPKIETKPQTPELEVQKIVPQKPLPIAAKTSDFIEVKDVASNPPAPPTQALGSEYGNSTTGQKSATYLELLQLSVQEISQIPVAARQDGIAGDAILRMTFNRSGYVRHFQLVRATGNKILDNAAIEAAQKLKTQPFPPMPVNFERGKSLVTYDFPISFKP